MRTRIRANDGKFMLKGRLVLMMLILLGAISSSQNLSATADSVRNTKSDRQNLRNQTAVKRSNYPILLGLYAPDYLGTQSVIDSQLRQVDNWAGKRHAIAGFFFDIEDPNPGYNIPTTLEQLRQNGYTAFINLESTRTAAQIAKGDVDSYLQKVAKAYADWSNRGEGRMVFIAPLQEMNIPGEAYAKDPNNFKLAYQRIQQIFKAAGVSAKAVRWVFAPNGWSENEQNRFENYYPGSDRVDVVAFSAYNWGYCGNASWKHWSSAKEAFAPYIKRMQAMAPSKPIFIAQTGTTSSTQKGSESSAKDQWFRDSYTGLAEMDVRAILYFNINKECDWALYSNSSKSAGYKDAVTNPAFGYVSPADLYQF